MTEGPVQIQSGRPEERPLCFASFARTGTLGWLILNYRAPHVVHKTDTN